MKSEITITEIYQSATNTKSKQSQLNVVAIGDNYHIEDYAKRIHKVPLICFDEPKDKNKMFDRIVENINKRIASQPDSRCATDDEVDICWLVCEVHSLRKKINDAEYCLDTSVIHSDILVKDALKILKKD